MGKSEPLYADEITERETSRSVSSTGYAKSAIRKYADPMCSIYEAQFLDVMSRTCWVSKFPQTPFHESIDASRTKY